MRNGLLTKVDSRWNSISLRRICVASSLLPLPSLVFREWEMEGCGFEFGSMGIHLMYYHSNS